jgi:hypothetical protein
VVSSSKIFHGEALLAPQYFQLGLRAHSFCFLNETEDFSPSPFGRIGIFGASALFDRSRGAEESNNIYHKIHQLPKMANLCPIWSNF